MMFDGSAPPIQGQNLRIRRRWQWRWRLCAAKYRANPCDEFLLTHLHVQDIIRAGLERGDPLPAGPTLIDHDDRPLKSGSPQSSDGVMRSTPLRP
ncbi:hypothetical protein ONE62_43115 (plasmid) [Rhodococcus opacus]|nr:hypothetical protein ONE62_43115 [Rhodococcus opacus]